jgi:DNA modification methylase
MQGEFPWCLDDSQETDSPSDMIGSFDLIMAQPARLARSGGAKLRAPLDRCLPETGWLAYAELFLREHGSMLIFTPLESIGAYVCAATEAGLIYQTTYLWQGEDNSEQQPEAIVWISKDSPRAKPTAFKNNLINAAGNLAQTGGDEKQWLMEMLIEAFSKPEMVVLEPFMSSSRILSACQKLRRYCLAVARKRSHIKQAEQALAGALKRTA